VTLPSKNQTQITTVAIAASIFAGGFSGKALAKAEAEPMKPDGSMQMWYYPVARLFRYPIPTYFEFAYIDKSGKVVVNGPFALAESFSHGTAVVALGSYVQDGGQWKVGELNESNAPRALLNVDGHVSLLKGLRPVGAVYDELIACSFSTGQPGYILVDRSGKVVSEIKGLNAGDFSDGLIAVQEDAAVKLPGLGVGPASLHLPKWGYRDKSGASVISPQYALANRFSEGVAAVCLEQNIFKASSKSSARFFHPNDYSYIDKTGKTAIAGPFMEAHPFKSGLAAVMQGGKWGYINKSGKLVVPCQYDWAGDFGGPLAPVESKEKVGFIDATGKIVIPFKFKDAREFSDGLAPATTDARSWGYINPSGEFVIPPRFQRAFPFSNGRALVYTNPRSEITLTASDAAAVFIAGQHHRNVGQINEARAEFAEVIALAPGSQFADQARLVQRVGLPDHNLSLDVQAVYLKGIKNAEAGQWSAAEQFYKKAIALDPAFFSACGSLAHVLIKQKRYDEAIKLLQDTVSAYPSYARGYRRLGVAYKAKGLEELSAANFAKAKSLDPEEVELQ
jgi:predicted negative regulator of RcsB-dependent stress response